MSTAVKKIKEYGERDLTKGFMRFMMHHSFQSDFCNPNSGHEKGSVENKVGYHRRNLFVPVPEFKDLKEYNKELLKKCDKDMERIHYKHSRLIKDMFVEDKAEFLKLPKTSFEVFIHEFAKADNYGKIKFDGRTYSASPELSGKILVVKAGAHDVEIMDQECNHIVSHKRLYGDEKESMNWVPYLEVLAKRPTAIKYTGLFNQLPQILKEHLNSCYADDELDEFAIGSLTWQGHEFLDTTKNDKIWKKALSFIGNKIASVSFEVLKGVLVQYAKDALK
jgi:hypothetical protein